MGEIIRIVRYQLTQLARNPRLYMIVILNSIFSAMFLLPIRKVLESYHTLATPWAFIFLFSQASVIFCFMGGIIILFSDAPFFNRTQMFLVIRVGKRKWLTGQLIYMLIAGMLYYVLLYGISLVFLLPFITLKNEWGSIWNSLARSDIGLNYGIYLVVPTEILNCFTPLQALRWLICMGTLNSFLIGLVMLCSNLFFKKEIGICIGIIMILLPYRLEFMPIAIHYIATVAWINPQYRIENYLYRGPGMWEQLGIVTGMIMLLTVLCFAGIQRRDIPEVLK